MYRKLEKAIECCDLQYKGINVLDNNYVKEYLNNLVKAEENADERAVVYLSLPHSDVLKAAMLFYSSIRTYLLNSFSVDDYIDTLDIDGTVLYGKHKYPYTIIRKRTDEIVLMDSRGSKGLKVIVPKGKFNCILRYNNAIENGLKNIPITSFVDNRIVFFHELLGGRKELIPNELDKTSLILGNPDEFKNIFKDLKLGIKSVMNPVDFASIFIVTGVNSVGNEEIFPGNYWHGDANVYICKTMEQINAFLDEFKDSVVSVWSDDETMISRHMDDTKLMVKNKNVPLVTLDFHYRLQDVHEMVKMQKPSSVMLMTPERAAELAKGKNDNDELLKSELNALSTGKVNEINLKCGFSVDSYKRLIDLVHMINFVQDEKTTANNFIVLLLAAVKRLLSAVRPVGINDEILHGVDFASILVRVKEISDGFYNDELREYSRECHQLVVDLYNSISAGGRKKDELNELLSRLGRKNRILIVVPTKGQINPLLNAYKSTGIAPKLTVCTPKKIEKRSFYDVMIITGKMSLYETCFLAHIQARLVYVLLYECEQEWICKQKNWFNYYMQTYTKLAKNENHIKGEEPVMPDFMGERLENEDLKYLVSDDIDTTIDKITMDFYDLLQKATPLSRTKVSDAVGFAVLEDGRKFVFTEHRKILVVHKKLINKEKLVWGCSVVKGKEQLKKIESETTFLYCHDFGNRNELIENIITEMGDENEDVGMALSLTKEWKRLMNSYKEDNKFTYEDLQKELARNGAKVKEPATVRSWLHEESDIVGPNNSRDFEAVCKMLHKNKDLHAWEEYAKATRLIRSLRVKATNKITMRIPKIYVENLNGDIVEEKLDKIDKIIFNELENLTELLCVDKLEIFPEPLSVNTCLLNRPLDREDVLLNG